LERKYSIPIVTSGMILVEAARALGIKKLLVLSSFDDGRSADRLAKYRFGRDKSVWMRSHMNGLPW